MVKEKNYNHKELGILKHEDIIRMKVNRKKLSKSFENLPKRRKNLKSAWLRRKNNKSWL